MATSHTIPSKLVTDGSAVTASSKKKLYITAILIAGDVIVDGVTSSAAGPVALPSPLICDTFTAAAAGQVAYYEI